jgi:rhodanese-related sulfurtransferase
MRSLILTASLLLPAAFVLAADHTTDTTDQVKTAIADMKAVLIDVREQKEWQSGHLKDAKLLPLSKLKNGTTKDEIERAVPNGKIVYLHCKSGGRCRIAADILKKHGYDVRPLKQGYEELVEAGFPKAPK